MTLHFLRAGVLSLLVGGPTLLAQPPSYPPRDPHGGLPPHPGLPMQPNFQPQPGYNLQPGMPLPPGPGAAPPASVYPPPPQPMHMYQQPVFLPPPRPLRIQDYSLTFIPPGPPRLIKEQDIITVLVDEKSQVVLQSRFDRQRTGTFQAQLNEFIRLGEDGTLDNAAENSPTINSKLQNQLRTSGQVYDQEGITYRIAATVVDVLPNGNIVLEARKDIYSNGDYWEYTLTGVLRSDDIASNNTAHSENIANLKIVKKMKGKVHNSTRLPWGTRLLDFIFPF